MQKYSTLKAKLIYVFTIPDAAHQGCVKVGEATLDEGINLSLQPNSSELNKAAKARIDQYTKTAGIQYQLRHTELAFSVHGGFIGSFNDTPTGQELIVSEGNKVEYGGELFTLAQFTSKYMPRNKRSVSGVCQGPRYFSYNGVSLYKLKESFLGGKKK